MRRPYKIMLQALIPVIIVASVTGLLMNYHSLQLTKDEIAAFQKRLLDVKRTGLRSYVSLAQASIFNTISANHSLGRSNGDDKRVKDRALHILNSFKVDRDAGIFVFDFDGNILVQPRQPDQIGISRSKLRESKDSSGVSVLRHFIRRARRGGGFEHHGWKDPKTGKPADWLSYVVSVDNWRWVLGASINIDDISEHIRSAEAVTATRFRENAVVIGAMTVNAVIIIVVAAMFFGLQERREANRKLKELTHRIVDTQEEERGRVARELHDGISQVLVSVKYALELARLRADQKSEEVGGAIDTGAKRLDTAIREVRRISRDLRPHILDDLGMSPALESLASEFSERTGIEVNISTIPFRRSLPRDAKTTLFRVAQEALTNIERHAHASRVTIALEVTRRGIEMKIADDGHGFGANRYDANNRSVGGLGLRNMKERLAYHNGEFDVISSMSGTTIVARLPRSLLTGPTGPAKSEDLSYDETKQAENQSLAG